MPSYNRLLHEIRQRISYERLFGEFAEMRGSGNERLAKCVFHEDSNPSMSINVADGLFCCHNPDCGAQGDFVEFFMRVRDLNFGDAVKELARFVGMTEDQIAGHRDTSNGARSVEAENEEVLARFRVTSNPPIPSHAEDLVIDEAIVESAHVRLMASPQQLEWLETRRGLSREIILEYQLGHDGDRYFIPIRNEERRCVNIRRYKPGSQGPDKMISWRRNYGQARLFPADAFLQEGRIYLFEGEWDCLLARSHGLNAVTSTGGAGTWREIWNAKFRDREVVICYDNDSAGRAGSLRVGRDLLSVTERVKLVTVPLSEPPGADFTDFIVGHGHSIADFHVLVDNAPFLRAEQVRDVETPAREPENLHLSQASLAKYYNAPVRFNVMLSGKTMAPYLVPKEVKLTCSMPGEKMCEHCPVAMSRLPGPGNLTRGLDYDTNEVLQFIDVTDKAVSTLLKSKVGVPSKCGYVDIEIVESLNVEELQLIPEIDRSGEETPYVTRSAFYLGHGLKTNESYIMTGLTVPTPKQQLATHIIHSVVAAKSNIDSFVLSEGVKEKLRMFQPAEQTIEGLWTKLASVYGDIEKATRIYQRQDLMLGVDLTFHSALSFDFQGERLARGWTELLVIGDSRTGKTTIVQRMMQYYGAGEFSSGENTSLAGLIGGLNQMGTSWVLHWGRIPLNDRRLLAVDEAGNLTHDQISRLSSMRSSGIAEVIKIHTERTNSRTRLIWISNPRSPRPLSTFSQGVLAVKELMGAPEDIARFDIVVTAASGDVSLSVVNSQREVQSPEVFTSELCHQRVMWAWSRKPDHIQFTELATSAVLRIATLHGQQYRYATEIPLVEPNEQRVKLARLAVAAAILFYSTDETGENVIVEDVHVRFAAQFLERLYAKPSLAFDEYARMQARRYEVTNQEQVRLIVTRQAGAIQALMEQEQLTQRDLMEILGYADREELRVAIGVLRDSGFLRRQGSSYYIKTSGANTWLRERLSGVPVYVDSGETERSPSW